MLGRGWLKWMGKWLAMFKDDKSVLHEWILKLLINRSSQVLSTSFDLLFWGVKLPKGKNQQNKNSGKNGFCVRDLSVHQTHEWSAILTDEGAGGTFRIAPCLQKNILDKYCWQNILDSSLPAKNISEKYCWQNILDSSLPATSLVISSSDRITIFLSGYLESHLCGGAASSGALETERRGFVSAGRPEQCAMCNVQCAMCNVKCAMCNVQCARRTIYIGWSTFAKFGSSSGEKCYICSFDQV